MSENSVFGPGYANHYDHFYAEKDYAAECDFLEEVFRHHTSQPVRTILDLGCGAGGHILRLAQRGYRLTGVDRSETMLAAAQRKLTDLPVHLVAGDIRTMDLQRTFDVVTSMFAVMSYMTTNEDLLAAFRTVRRHLVPGGLFCFDVWSGIAVLNEPPVDRFKIIQRDDSQILRLVHPEMDLAHHLVHVNYRILHLQQRRLIEDSSEIHTMRYLFPQEISFLLDLAGLRVLSICPFMHLDRQISESDWNLTVVAEATGNGSRA